MMSCRENALQLEALAVVGVVLLLITLALVIAWPLRPRAERLDPMQEPFGDQPRMPS